MLESDFCDQKENGIIIIIIKRNEIAERHINTKRCRKLLKGFVFFMIVTCIKLDFKCVILFVIFVHNRI
jgi:hypothetical protein